MKKKRVRGLGKVEAEAKVKREGSQIKDWSA